MEANIYVVYNSRTNGFLKIDKSIYKILEEAKNDNLLIGSFPEETIKEFRRMGILVEADEDYTFLLEHQLRTNMETYGSENLFLTIASTLDCNCCCSYCFEKNKTKAYLNNSDIDAIYDFINKYHNIYGIHICWFGGEPLLAFDKIREFLNGYANNVSEKPLLSQSIITNGLLFDKEKIDFFSKYSLTSIQITLDGIKQHHDSVRKLKGTGMPTYDTIIENIDEILNKMPETQVSVRVNVDKTNIEDYTILSDELYRKWDGMNIYIYPGFIFRNEGKGRCTSCNVFNAHEKARLLLEFREKYNPEALYPSLSFGKGCAATIRNGYVLAPEGRMYKCLQDVGNEERIIGNYKTDEVINPKLFYQYLQENKWYNREECKECSLLPICDGGCAHDYQQAKESGVNPNTCENNYKFAGLLQGYLKSYYHAKIKEESL